MIAYFDTSALIPLLIEEPTTLICQRLWNDAARVASVRLVYTEACAALDGTSNYSPYDDAARRSLEIAR